MVFSKEFNETDQAFESRVRLCKRIKAANPRMSDKDIDVYSHAIQNMYWYGCSYSGEFKTGIDKVIASLRR